MRWRNWVGGLALVVMVLAGCKQQCFLTEYDYDHYRSLAAVGIDNNPGAGSVVPDVSSRMTAAPATVLNPDRKIRYISLAEVIAIALEQGNVGPALSGFGFGLSGTVSDATVSGPIGSFTNGALDRDNIRVLALDPGAIATNIENSLSKFDTRWVSSMTWNNTDVPIATALQVFQAGGANLGSIVTEAASFSSGLIKPLSSGGIAGITFNNNYTLTNLPNPVNPAYQPQLLFQFEQPLLQGFGVEINQITSTIPGSLLTPIPTGGQVEGILVTRLRFDQARADFERSVAQLLLNVEISYWNLYQAYGILMAREMALRINYEVWKIVHQKFQAGAAQLAEESEARGQYETSRGQRIAALGGRSGQQGVLEAERNLRGLLGMHVEDGYRLVPSDAPTLTPFYPDWETALQEAFVLKPELLIMREQLKIDQFNVVAMRNQLLPDLRFVGTYDVNALGNTMAGTGANNALQQLASNHYNDWMAGLRMTMPIGFRQAHSQVRQARLRLAQSYYALETEEQKVERFLASQYRNIFETYAQIGIQRSRREAYAGEVEANLQLVRNGRRTADVLRLPITYASDALADEYLNIAAYQNSLASFQWAKGTMLRHDNIVIADGPLPKVAQVRAVEHEAERTKALIARLREKPSGIPRGPGEPTVPIFRTVESLPTALGDELPATPELPPPTSMPAGSPPNGPQAVNPSTIPALQAAPQTGVAGQPSASPSNSGGGTSP